MSKLVAEGGKITKQSIFKADTFTVRFKCAAICTTGDSGQVVLIDNAQPNENQFVLTYAQAISLAHEILRRC